MNNKLNTLLRQLRDLKKSYDKLNRAVPNPETAERNADNTLQAVLKSLDETEIKSLIDDHIGDARGQLLDNFEAFDKELTNQAKTLRSIEIKLAQPAIIRKRDYDMVFNQYLRSKKNISDFVSSVTDIRNRVVEVHEASKNSLSESRNLTRIEKKKRKRNISQGIASAVFGTAAIAANTQLPIVFAFSYGLGGGALHQAMRDIVGTAGE